jgi:hypothetical protein
LRCWNLLLGDADANVPLFLFVDRARLNPIAITVQAVKNLPMDGLAPSRLADLYHPVYDVR